PAQAERKILVSMLAAHPYEEVAHQIFNIENSFSYVGSGVIGNLEEPMEESEFLAYLKERMNLNVIRHTKSLGKKISRVAVCGGAGGFLLGDAKRSGADIFITADYKYHEIFDSEGEIIIADIVHFVIEQFTKEILLDIIHNNYTILA